MQTSNGSCSPEPIAIVGMGCRFPGGNISTSKLWDFLAEGKSGFSEFPPDRFSPDAFHHPNRDRPGSMVSRGGFILEENVKDFDHSLFGLSPTETLTLDPAQRKLLEVTFEAFESAGEPLHRVRGSRTGVFVGNMNNDHQTMHLRDVDHILPYTVTGSGPTILSNRISYIFDLQGPSMVVDTACSASLYALHLAVNAIRNNDCDAAVVAASNLILSPDAQLFTTKLGAISPTSICHSFDIAADGYARAEGIGALYLKPLSKAISDGDPIRACIRGTAFNANGKTGGISRPSADGQEALMRKAYEAAGNLNPDDTGYLECHGTGTPVGDPIEVSAVGRVFAAGRADAPLLIGSVKTNLGHSEAASGMSQVMKAILSMEHEMIPATIGIKTLNPSIDFAGSRVQVVTKLTPWPNDLLRRTSINSFGYGGANAHCILDHPSVLVPNYIQRGLRVPRSLVPYQNSDECSKGYTNGHANGTNESSTNGVKPGNKQRSRQNPQLVPSNKAGTRKFVLLPFSAHTESAMKAQIASFGPAFDAFNLADILYTLGARRSQFDYRSFFVENSASIKEIQSSIPADLITYGKVPDSPVMKIGFVFTGQGAQWPGMGSKLLEEYAVFRSTIRYLDSVLDALSNKPSWSIEQALSETHDAELVHRAEVSQTVCTALQIAMVDLLSSWNVEPAVTVGHSSGEIAAAYAADRLPASEAIILAYCRGQAVARNQQKGAMLAVGLHSEDAAVYLEGIEHGVKIAAINSPSSVTLSGDIELITRLARVFEADGVFSRILKTGGNAYHSHHMVPIGEIYENIVSQGMRDIQEAGFADIHPRGCHSVTWVSSVTPQKTPSLTTTDATYWRGNLESPVNFSSAIQTLAYESPVDLLIEIGPHPALGGPIKQIASALEQKNVKLPPCLESLRRGQNDCLSLVTLAGQLFLKNTPVNLAAVNATDSKGYLTHGYPCIDLPGYEYDYGEKPIYHENRASKELRLRKFPRHDLLGSRQPGVSPTHPSWKNVIRSKDLPWLEDHKLQSHAVLPGTAYIAMAIEAVRQLVLEEAGSEPIKIRAFKLRNVAIRSTLRVPDTDAGIETILSMERLSCLGSRSSIEFQFSVSSFETDDDNWTEHCSGLISIDTTNPIVWDELTVDKRSRQLDITRWYERFTQAGLVYGPVFQGLSKLQAFWGSNIAQAQVALCPTAGMINGGESEYPLHPATLDACLQLILISCNAGQVENMKSAFVPIHVNEATIWANDEANASQAGQAIATGYTRGLRGAYGRVQLYSSSGEPLLDIREIRCASYDGSSIEAGSNGSTLTREPFCRTVWRPDIDFLSPSQTRKLFSEESILRDTLRDLNTLAELVISKAHQLSLDGMEGHSDFVRWVSAMEEVKNPGMMNTTTIGEIYPRLDGITEAQALQKLSDHLPSILRGESTSIRLLMEDDLLRELEVSGLATRAAISQLRKVVDLLAHKHPNLRILEVCGGSGSLTNAVLDELDAQDSFKRFQTYTFTDPRGWCVKDAQGRFAGIPNMLYQTLDVDKDLAMQDFEIEKFDLVIAPPSLAWSNNLSTALENIHRLLRPGGKLLLLQTVNAHLALEMLTRTLAARWDQDFAPFLNHAQWNTALSTARFSGIEHALNDYSNTEISTVMVTSALPTQLPATLPKSSEMPVYLVYRGYPPPLIRALEKRLVEEGLKPISTELTIAPSIIPPKSVLISLIDIESPTILGAPDQFEALRDIILQSSNLTWVSLGSSVRQAHPESACMEGLLRSIRTEEPLSNISFVGLDDGFHAYLDRAAELLISVSTGIQTAGSGEFGIDHEYSLHDESLYIARHVFDKPTNSFFGLLHGFHETIRPQVVNKEYPFRASYKQPGVLSSLQFEIENDFFRPVPPGWVEIETKAIGLNMKDLPVALGKFDWPFLSTEVAGIVSKVGPNTTKFQIGDRVFGAVPGNMGNYTRADETLVQKIPSNASFAEAASMPLSYLTAVYALKHLGRLQMGESVLIQYATGGLGMAAMKVACSVGAKIYATVGSETKRQILINEFGIPNDRIFNSRSLEFTTDIMRATEGLGIDVILNAASGNAMHEAWRCIASFGRFIDVGRMDVHADDRLNLDVFKRNASFSSFDMGAIYLENPRLMARLMQEVRDMWETGIINPTTYIKTFDISELEVAMKEFAKGTHIGKLVITFDNPETELMLSQKPRRVTFDPNATYLLVGCLGGLGRSLAMWMVDRGARHMAFLSRSGVQRPEAAALIEELEAKGAKPDIIQGSVTDSDVVTAAVHQISSERPLKGVIHAAMSEGDAIFQNARFSQIESVLAPKVTGTVNLHNATLGHDLDFFVMTSSTVAAMGTPSQGAYCAGNAFQNAFARHRKAQGLTATTFAVGLIKEVGIIREVTPFQQMLERVGSYGISETELLQLLEIVFHPDAQLDFQSSDPLSSSQMSIGFEPARLFSKYAQPGRMSDLLWHTNPQFQAIIQAVSDHSFSSSSQLKSTSSIRANIELACDPTEARAIALDGVVEHLARLLGLEKQDISPQTPIVRYGIDSLIAAEIRTWLMKTFGVELSLLQFLSSSMKVDDIVEAILIQTSKEVK